MLALLVSRAAIEAVLFAGLVALLHAVTAPTDAVGLGQATAALFGLELVGVAVLREAHAESGSIGESHQTTGLAVGTVGVAIVVGLVLLPWRASDVPTFLMRAIGFGILGEAFLWRALSLARGLSRWSQVRSSGTLAALVILVAAFVPHVDHDALPLLALVSLTATGVGLSLARSTEELELAGEEGRGVARGGSALGTAFALGVLALVVAAFAPSLQSLLASSGDAVAPFLAQALFFLLLPLGYVAAYLVDLFRGLVGQRPPQPPQPPTLADIERDEQMRRAMLETRPVVVVAFELLIAAVAVVFVIVLVERMRRERRAALPAGASLERERIEGSGVRDMLAGLLPRRPRPRRRPADDGTPAAAVRLLYWRLLELAERAGVGWRADDETPSEHAARLYRAGEPWPAAAPVVRAFELVRYAERTPPDSLVESARAALRMVERPRAAGSLRENSPGSIGEHQG